ncbi:MAG TPA: efflux RND transporter periplasmic adaptor subunit, partial [Anaerolineae bacterium]|nr:efflux RND transporter periplasmic adaptor subunit [Anaerolineae bacterium]
ASISVVGEMDAPQNEALRFERVAGTTHLATMEVAAGQIIEAGQVLATIDPTPYQQALDQARSDLQVAQQALADLQTPPTDLDLAQADLRIAQQELAVQQAEDALETLQDPDIDDLRSAVSDAQLSLTQDQADLAAAQPGSSSEDQLAALNEKESDLYQEYSRLAGETYSDTYFQDRLRLAHNAFLEAQDTRIRSELQQQISLARAQMQVRQAERKLANAQETLTEALAGVDALDLAEAQQAVAQAQADLADAREARVDLDEGVDAVKLAAAQADVDKKQLAVSEAEADLAAATLTAPPWAGTVLQVNAEAGDRITAGSEILTIANLDELQVVASVDETTIRQVSAGQPASISFDAFPGQTFTGQVLSVPLQGTLQGGIMVYEVPISLVGAEDLPLLVGMTANVDIATGQAENALLVPTMALQTINGLYQVLVPNSDPEGDPISVPVEVGLSNGTYTQIVRGLNPGDQVVVQLSSSDSEGMFRMGPGGGMDVMAAPAGGPPGGAPPSGGPGN